MNLRRNGVSKHPQVRRRDPIENQNTFIGDCPALYKREILLDLPIVDLLSHVIRDSP